MENISMDLTQIQIHEQLLITQQLVEKLGHFLSGKKTTCELSVMEDLGFSNNITRMAGGFFTGMYLQWDCDRYFIPVDSTVNACGVSIYEFDSVFINFESFISAVSAAISSLEKDGIKWNYNSGNHFVSLCIAPQNENKQYLILHASANQYKFGVNGLYPDERTWFYSKIRTLEEGNRYIRYIVDETAEQFYSLYLKAAKENPLRNDEVAKRIVGEEVHRVLYSPHYGMPAKNSIAIGCQWNPDCVILTSFGNNIYNIRLESYPGLPLTPHGFGVCFKNDLQALKYLNGKLYINGENVENITNGFLSYGNICNRYADQTIDKEFITKFLSPRRIHIIAEYKQLYSYNRNGFADFSS